MLFVVVCWLLVAVVARWSFVCVRVVVRGCYSWWNVSFVVERCCLSVVVCCVMVADRCLLFVGVGF